ncbi:MAG: tRNA (adenosine(37)-N6)-dimethylallyltransferase MiaA, partial [Candidatus Moraniibacteriota bacterium]
ADSRQVYRGLNIGTGKEPGKWDAKKKAYISQDIPHYLIDNVSPRTEYNAAKFKNDCDKIIIDILKRGKIPIVCGGTGFWIKALADNVVYPEVAPDWKLRERLNKKSTETLFKELQKLDPQRAKNIDAKNPVRLIRAIEICKSIGKVPDTRYKIQDTRYKFIQIGIKISKEKLNERIRLRLQKRFLAGMIEEVEKLHFENKISWKRLESFGLGYKFIPQYLRKEIATEKELFEKIYQGEKDYAKRQMTWFKKDKRIIWLEKYKDIESEIKDFLK